MSEVNVVEDNRSLAVCAHSWQNLDVPTAENPGYGPEGTAFPGHDTFQNGVIPENQPTTLYTAATDRDIENIKNKNSNFSGFFTDADTVNTSCKNGVLDANDYAERTQTKPWRPSDAPSGTEYTYRPNVAAFDVNWDEFNKPENKDLKDKLCNPDGLSPDSGDIKAAYGKAEANTHWGRGGGNQYYIDKDTFNEGVNRGVFQYKEDKSFMESKGNLERKGVSEDDMDVMDARRTANIEKQLSSCPCKSATSSVDKAKSLNEITPEKESKINSDVAAKGNYVTSPDPAYNYGQNANVSNNNGVSPKTNPTDKVTDGGGARAPNNKIRGNTDNPPEVQKTSQKPPQDANNAQIKEPTQRVHLPENNAKTAQNNTATSDSTKADYVAKNEAGQAAKNTTLKPNEMGM